MPRPQKLREPIDQTYNARFTETQMNRLRSHAAATGRDISVIVRDAVTNELEGKHRLAHGVEVSIPIVGTISCGPFTEAIPASTPLLLSEHIAERLEVRDGDLFWEAHGQSMTAAGIPDGALVLLRPLPEGRRPRAGEITLVQIFDGDGGCESTLKHYYFRNGREELEDAEGNNHPIPPTAERILPVAIARGVIGAL